MAKTGLTERLCRQISGHVHYHAVRNLGDKFEFGGRPHETLKNQGFAGSLPAIGRWDEDLFHTDAHLSVMTDALTLTARPSPLTDHTFPGLRTLDCFRECTVKVGCSMSMSLFEPSDAVIVPP